MISPHRTRKLTNGVHRLGRRCSTKATIPESTTMIVTLETVRMTLLMNAMTSR